LFIFLLLFFLCSCIQSDLLALFKNLNLIYTLLWNYFCLFY